MARPRLPLPRARVRGFICESKSPGKKLGYPLTVLWILATHTAPKITGSITNRRHFSDRNSTCATRLIWEYLLDIGVAVTHLEPLVQITFQGDTHRNSEALKQSRINGPHAELTKLKNRIQRHARGLSTDGSLAEELYKKPNENFIDMALRWSALSEFACIDSQSMLHYSS